MDSPGDIMRLCRLCLVKDQVNVPIFEDKGDIKKIFLKISSCLPVKVSRDDKLPKKICDGCSNKLDMLYEFWTTAANAEKTLLSWLGQAGVKDNDADETMSAVAQQIQKPAEPYVKQETLDPEAATNASEVGDHFLLQNFMQKFSYNESASTGPSATVTSNAETDEPPPKRARRTAAVKAQINISAESEEDDDNDAMEAMTKVEDESDESDGEDREPAYVDVPGTSGADDDQPGPSGVGKDGVEAPSNHPQTEEERQKLLKFCNKQCIIILTDICKEKNSKFFNQKNTTSRRKYSCYLCFTKFATKDDLKKHKLTHTTSEEEEEDDDVITLKAKKDEYVCGAKNCNAKFTSHVKLCQHRTIHSDSEEEEEEETGKELSEIKTEDDDASKNYFCVQCKVAFEDQHAVKSHPHTQYFCKYFCKLCNRNFNTRHGFVVHIIQHDMRKLPLQSTEESSKIKASCNVVPKVTASPKPSESLFYCEQCYDVFTTKKALNEHMEHHKTLERIQDEEIPNETTKKIKPKPTEKYAKILPKPAPPPPQPTPTTSGGFKPDKTTLTAQIKEILASGNATTKYLQPPKLIPIFKPNTQQNTSVPSTSTTVTTTSSGVTLKKTGPTSFSLNYTNQTVAQPTPPPPPLMLAPTATSCTNSVPTTGYTVVNHDQHAAPAVNYVVLVPQGSVGQSFTQTPTNVVANGTNYIYYNPQVSTVQGNSMETANRQVLQSTADGQYVINQPVANQSVVLNPQGSQFHLGGHFMQGNLMRTPQTTTCDTNILQSTLQGKNIQYTNAVPTQDATTEKLMYILIPTNKVKPPTTQTKNVVTLKPKETTETPSGSVKKKTILIRPQKTEEKQSPKRKDVVMPVITNITTVGEGSKPVKNDPSSNYETEFAKFIKHGPIDPECVKSNARKKTEAKQNVIFVDSDSNSQEARSDAELVIDETSQDNANKSDQTRPKIFVKKLSDLLEKPSRSYEQLEEEKAKKKKKWNFPIKCDNCHLSFNKYRTYRAHNEKKLSCNRCDFKSCKINPLRDHFLLTHRMHLCAIFKCGYLSCSSQELNDHVAEVHTCKMCSGVYASNQEGHVCKVVPSTSKTKTKATQ